MQTAFSFVRRTATMAAAADTRERPGARGNAGLADPNEDIASLLTSGFDDEGDDEGDGGDLSGSDDELELVEDSGDEEDEDEGEGDGSAGEEAGEDSETAGDGTPAAADAGLSEYVTAWAAKVRAKPLAIMQVPGNRRAAVLTGAFAAERKAATEALREPLQRTLEQVTRDAYEQGKTDARAELDGDAEFDEVRDLAENDLAAFGQLAHSAEGQAKVRRYLERLEAEKNPQASQGVTVIKTTAERLLAKVRGNDAAMAELRKKEAAEPGRYGHTAAGLEALAEDVAEALANARVAAASKAADPEKKAAAARQNGAVHRSALPRVAGGEGRAGAGTADISVFASAADDLRAGLREDTRRRS